MGFINKAKILAGTKKMSLKHFNELFSAFLFEPCSVAWREGTEEKGTLFCVISAIQCLKEPT